jgi:predicted AlkP superfamily pyrophosphatase or phosphodiesterase
MPLHKTKIEGGSAWQWYADPEPDGVYLAMATFIELESMWSLPRFEWYTRRVHRQLGRTPGLIGYSFRGRFPFRYWTLSAWENGRALSGFVKAGRHRTVMTGLLASTRDFGQVHWKVTGAELPLNWADGLQRMSMTP